MILIFSRSIELPFFETLCPSILLCLIMKTHFLDLDTIYKANIFQKWIAIEIGAHFLAKNGEKQVNNIDFQIIFEGIPKDTTHESLKR